MNIHLFGATTLAGQSLIRKASQITPDYKINRYSRSGKYGIYADLTEPSLFEFSSLDDPSFLISYAPIWLFAPFLQHILNKQPEKLREIKGIIACSSSSVITKRFASNKHDKDLVASLKEAESSILSICEALSIPCTIIRPTLIYGQSGSFNDNNLSKITNLMRFFLFLPIPSETGLRQPIHASQLAEVSLYLINNKNNRPQDLKHQKCINLGGDEEIKYRDMILSFQDSLTISDKAKRCKLVPIPNRVFFFIASPLLLFSPKMYSAIQRISTNLSGFTPSCKLLGIKPRKFPLTPLAK